MSEMEILVDRGLPASMDAERAILGAILLDNSAFYQAESFLTPGDFSLDSHRRIYLRMVELVKRDAPIDFVTLTELLKQHKEIETVGGVAYVTSLTDGLPRVKNISQYVKIVRDKAMLRQLIHASTSTLQQAYDQEEAAENTVTYAQDALLRIIANRYPERDLEEVARSTINQLEELRRYKGECIGYTTGHADLDLVSTGLRDGEVAVFGARPGNGKTALMCQGVRRNLKRGEKVGVFSIEIPAEQFFIRLACLETGIHVFDTRDPRVLSPERYGELQEAVAFFANDFKGKLFLDDTPGIATDQLCAKARAWAFKEVGLVYVDHLHLMDLMVNWPLEFDRISNSIKRLWYLSRSTKQALAVMAQLKRLGKGNPRPGMEDLRAAGTIEQFGHFIGMLWRDLQFDESGESIIGSTGNDEILIPKQRSGPANIKLEAEFKKEVGYWAQRVGRKVSMQARN